MKLVFMGTPEFARVVLAHLCQSDQEILAVVTGADQKSGRGLKMVPSACFHEAEAQGLRVFTPASLKDPDLHESLRVLQPDLFVVCAFRKLPKTLFTLPRFGSINVHMSLLPKYRGAAPINWALINGETETGLSSFFLKESIDTGDLILQERVSIFPDDNFDSLAARLAEKTGPFLLKTIGLIESEGVVPMAQDDSRASHAPKINPADALIDFGLPAERVRNFVRGMSTRPGAYTYFREKKLKLHACTVANDSPAAGERPGTILEAKKRLLVQCDHSAVELIRLVPEGKNEMDGKSFINGYHPKTGEVLGKISQGVREV
ncbi:MAG: methionyl-tRNA formyltransferase [Planctomycetes bacterium]|nr:methionyl-tRNA formyltransferase [Planctomycetota bacterium]